MLTQYRLVQSGKTASVGCSAGQGSPRIIIYYYLTLNLFLFSFYPPFILSFTKHREWLSLVLRIQGITASYLGSQTFCH
jgi:hypothetical protein